MLPPLRLEAYALDRSGSVGLQVHVLIREEVDQPLDAGGAQKVGDILRLVAYVE